MTTTRVIGLARGVIGYESFLDIVDEPPIDIRPAARGRTQLVFDGELSDDQAAAVWDRLTSIDADDLLEWQNLRAAMEAVRAMPVLSPGARLALLVARRMTQTDDQP